MLTERADCMAKETNFNMRISKDLKQLAQEKADKEMLPLSAVVRLLLKEWVEKP